MIQNYTKFQLRPNQPKLNHLQKTRIHITGCDGEEAGEFDDDAAGTLDAEDGSFDAFERAVDDADALAFLEFGCDILKIENVV